MKNPKTIIGILVLVVALIGCLMAFKSNVEAQTTQTATVVEVTDQNHKTEVLNSKLPVFMIFYTPTCGYCKQEEPIVQELAKEYAGKVKFVRVDASANPTLVSNLDITAVPTMFVLKLDEKLISANEGYLDKAELKKFIESGLAAKKP